MLGKRLITNAEEDCDEDMKKFKKVVGGLAGINPNQQIVNNATQKKEKKIEKMIESCLSEGSGGLEMASVTVEKAQKFTDGLRIALQLIEYIKVDFLNMARKVEVPRLIGGA